MQKENVIKSCLVEVLNRVILNLFQNLQCLSWYLLLRNNMRGRSRNKFGMTLCNYNTGFTLIELLVVVLIIGILAAVALPQYQKAVDKTRIGNYVAHIKQIVRAEQVYHMENGEYTPQLADLDVDVTKICKTRGGACASNELYNCPYNFGFDLGAGWIEGKCRFTSAETITLKYCPDSSNSCHSDTPYAFKAKYSIETGELLSCTGKLCPIVRSIP